MRYISFLILFIVSCLGSGPVFGQDTFYRVEILVLTHLRHDSEPLKVDQLRDFTDSLDFLAPPEPEEEEAGEDEEEPLTPLAGEEEAVPIDPETGLPFDAEPDPWADVLPIEERSDVMQEAWRRLRLSAPFRPQQYLSWVQSAEEPFPLLRLHNAEVVLIDDPYAEQRAALALAEVEDEPIVFSDQTMAGNADDATGDEPELPDPTLFYELDGTVKLIRTRFLHLEIDLEMRTAVYEDPGTEDAPPSQLLLVDGELVESPLPGFYEVHKLQQKRQVRSERMEYFDSPVIGVLAYITPFEPEAQTDLPEAADE